MLKSKFLSALLLAGCLAPGAASAGTPATDEFEQGLATFWEVLWHQSGIPTRVVRWEGEIRMRLSGVNVAAHRETVMQALRAVTHETGVRLVDVSDQPGQAVNLQVEITSDQALEDNQPCATTLELRQESRIDSAVVRMRGRDVWRCAHHEAMHVMGLRGHPAGKTVLSYFPTEVRSLLPLDRAMLRAWYSPRMRGGMTPLEALPVMADELIAGQADKAAAVQARNRFFANTIEQMHDYASGRGDIPTVIRRSGKSTVEGIREGRSEMSYFLGLAYLEGTGVPASDRDKALHWLQQAASTGNRGAQSRLGSFR